MKILNNLFGLGFMFNKNSRNPWACVNCKLAKHHFMVSGYFSNPQCEMQVPQPPHVFSNIKPQRCHLVIWQKDKIHKTKLDLTCHTLRLKGCLCSQAWLTKRLARFNCCGEQLRRLREKLLKICLTSFEDFHMTLHLRKCLKFIS